MIGFPEVLIAKCAFFASLVIIALALAWWAIENSVGFLSDLRWSGWPMT